MAQNIGKQFERDFASSIPSYCFVHRLRDSSQSYDNNNASLYSWNNECDYFIYDGQNSRLFFAIECKTTKKRSMSVQINKEDSSSSMIKYHQIQSLKKISEYKGTVAGLCVNFRHFEGEPNYTENTYFLEVNNMMNMLEKTGKKSFDELDIALCENAIKIKGVKKRVHFKWDIDTFFKDVKEIYK